MARDYGVMNTLLKDREFLAGNYLIADIACVGWANRAEPPRTRPERLSKRQALAPNLAGASGGQTRICPGGSGLSRRHEGSERVHSSVQSAR
jgi:hypothetical protein